MSPTWKRDIGRVPDHFQEPVGAYRTRCAQLELLAASRAVGSSPVGRDVVDPGELSTVYPEKWVEGRNYEEECREGPES